MQPVSMIKRRFGSGGDAQLVLELDLDRGVQTAPPTTPWEALSRRQTPTMRAIRDGLRDAAADDAVAGLVVHVGLCPLALADADELAELIEAFSAKKPSVAWTETFGELSSGLTGYRVALAAREIWLQPSGALGLTGVRLAITLLRGGLDKVGLDPEFGQRQEYKSAAERFAGTEISAANREMTQRLADAIMADTTARIERRRGLSAAAVGTAIDAAPLTAMAALEARLVDRLGYRDEVEAHVESAWSVGSGRRLRFVHRYAKESRRSPTRALTDRRRPAVAVIGVHGAIVSGPGRPSVSGPQAGSSSVAAQLRAAGRDDQVEAVLLRVNSPGGSYVASDTIRREVQQLREGGRPVVASMGAVAASGGYFVAMGADEIVANPTTLTGSIGVLAGKFVATRLRERIGLRHESIESGRHAGMMSSSAPFTDDEWRLLNAWLDDVYADFTAKAAADRGMALDVLEPLARGRVWLGTDAYERKLVDHLGGLDTALDRVCALIGKDRAAVSVRSGPAIPMLARLRPAENSESPAAAARTSLLTEVATLSTSFPGPEALLVRLARSLGVAGPEGALALPYRFDLT